MNYNPKRHRRAVNIWEGTNTAAESPKQNTVKENGSHKPHTEDSTPRPFVGAQVLLATADNTI